MKRLFLPLLAVLSVGCGIAGSDAERKEYADSMKTLTGRLYEATVKYGDDLKKAAESKDSQKIAEQAKRDFDFSVSSAEKRVNELKPVLEQKFIQENFKAALKITQELGNKASEEVKKNTPGALNATSELLKNGAESLRKLANHIESSNN